MVKRMSLLKIAMLGLFGLSLAALPLTIQAQENPDQTTKSGTTAKEKKKATKKSTDTTVSEPKATTTEPKAKAPTPGQAAMRERQKECGAEWRQAKEKGTLDKGATWPKFWSACNTRLKAKEQ